MKALKVFFMVVLAMCLTALPIYAMDDGNFGEADDFGTIDRGDNLGELESFGTEALPDLDSATQESVTGADSQSEVTQAQTQGETVTKPIVEIDPSDKQEQPMVLPMPVILTIIAGFGIFGIIAAIVAFIKFAK